MDLGLTGKVAIVTGGGEGIGRASAHRLAAEGANVVIIGRRAEIIEAAAREISASSEGRVVALSADVADPKTAVEAVATALEHFGRVDILVNNAGSSKAGRFEDIDRGDWDADFDVKFWGAVDLIRAVIPEMRRRGGGRIINVTNLDGRTPRAATMPTSIARAAGIAMTKGLSKELAADNILVNTVCIGFIKSGQHERRYQRTEAERAAGDLSPLYKEEAAKRGIPLGRAGESHEAGDVIAFLASERASYITGVAINIDGGTSPVV